MDLDLPRTIDAQRHLAFSGRRLGDYPELVAGLLATKEAAALANAGAGVIGSDTAADIVAACHRLLDGPDRGLFVVDPFAGGGGTAVNTNVNEAVALTVLRRTRRRVDPIAHVNASQSSTDVTQTGARLAILAVYERRLEIMLDAMAGALAGAANRFGGVLTLARTCLQDALPVSAGFLFEGAGAALRRRRRGLEAAIVELEAVNLGGTVIGTGAGAPRNHHRAVLQHLREVTGRPELRRVDHYGDAAQHADELAAAAGQLALVANLLARVASDLRLLSSGPGGGFAELVLAPAASSSTFFGPKANPTVPESMMACAFQLIGADAAAQAAARAGELHVHVFDLVAALNVLDGMEMLAAAGTLLATCVDDLTVDEARCRALCEHARLPRLALAEVDR